MPCPITTLTNSAIKKTTRKKTNNKISKNKNLKAKTQYLYLKAPSNNVKMQSDKTLTTQIYYFLLIQQISTLRLGNKSTKRGNNEAKFKNRLYYEHF